MNFKVYELTVPAGPRSLKRSTFFIVIGGAFSMAGT